MTTPADKRAANAASQAEPAVPWEKAAKPNGKVSWNASRIGSWGYSEYSINGYFIPEAEARELWGIKAERDKLREALNGVKTVLRELLSSKFDDEIGQFADFTIREALARIAALESGPSAEPTIEEIEK